MKKFLFKLSMVGVGMFIAIALEVVVYLLFLQFGVPQYTTSYNAAVLDKIERLESIDEPSIILVGNSSVAFGFDSAKLEEAMDMPVVNLGLHAALCNSFHEGLAMLDIDEGDIVVIAHSDYADETDAMDSSILWITIENHIELLPVLRLEYLFDLLKGFPNYLLNNLNLYIKGTGNDAWSGMYARDMFNEYGDNVYPREENLYVFSEDDTKTFQVSEVAAERLNEMNEYCISQGATLVVVGYPIAEGEYTAPVESYQDAQAQLEEWLDCDVISDFTDYFIPYEYFYDTSLHLTDEGVQIRTDLLIADLQAYLAD